MTIALIAGAGWKPADEWRLKGKWREIVPLRTPELLWPLPGGETVLSRYVAQLKSFGVREIFAGVGDPVNSPTDGVEDRHRTRTGAMVPGYGDPVWTRDKIDYIETVGAIPILVDDPMAPKKCCFSTILEMVARVARYGLKWDKAIVLMGDYVLSTAYLGKILNEASWPQQLWMLPKHSIEFLTIESFPAYSAHLKQYIPSGQTALWKFREELPYFKQVYEWEETSPDWTPEQQAAYHAERRKSFCEVGPGEYPHGWALAEGDPI